MKNEQQIISKRENLREEWRKTLKSKGDKSASPYIRTITRQTKLSFIEAQIDLLDWALDDEDTNPLDWKVKK